MCLGVNLLGWFFFFFPVWASFSFSYLWINNLCQIWEVFTQFFSNALSPLPSCSLLLRLWQYKLWAFCYYFWVNFINLTSNSLIFIPFHLISMIEPIQVTVISPVVFVTCMIFFCGNIYFFADIFHFFLSCQQNLSLLVKSLLWCWLQKSLLDKSSRWFNSMLASMHFLFSFKLSFSWFLGLQVIFHYILDIFYIMLRNSEFSLIIVYILPGSHVRRFGKWVPAHFCGLQVQ